jgi:hypothetical protein
MVRRKSPLQGPPLCANYAVTLLASAALLPPASAAAWLRRLPTASPSPIPPPPSGALTPQTPGTPSGLPPPELRPSLGFGRRWVRSCVLCCCSVLQRTKGRAADSGPAHGPASSVVYELLHTSPPSKPFVWPQVLPGAAVRFGGRRARRNRAQRRAQRRRRGRRHVGVRGGGGRGGERGPRGRAAHALQRSSAGVGGAPVPGPSARAPLARTDTTGTGCDLTLRFSLTSKVVTTLFSARSSGKRGLAHQGFLPPFRALPCVAQRACCFSLDSLFPSVNVFKRNLLLAVCLFAQVDEALAERLLALCARGLEVRAAAGSALVRCGHAMPPFLPIVFSPKTWFLCDRPPLTSLSRPPDAGSSGRCRAGPLPRCDRRNQRRARAARQAAGAHGRRGQQSCFEQLSSS